MKKFENLTQNERSDLLKFPAYISLLAANKIDGFDKDEKKSVIELTHIKTFSCNPVLLGFYKEADVVFKSNIEDLNNKLPKEKEEREKAINHELTKLEPILLKLGREYAMIMHKSMKSYTEHVSESHDNILVNFILPIYIKGLSID
jgi:hypothetical protein